MKKVLICLLAVLLLAAVLFTPIPGSSYEDGGTREYTALTYKIVAWNRLFADGIYEATKVYWLPDNFRDIDSLWLEEAQNVVHKCVATVLELSGSYVLVQPVPGEDELLSSDRISFSCADLGDIGAEVGSTVEVHYRGGIMESSPAQIRAVKWAISGNKRHQAFTDPWLGDTATEPHPYDNSTDVYITEIYSNCFFAESVIPMPYRYKFNGALSEDWCVGDQVLCSYKNARYDDSSHRMEADLVSVAPSTFEIDPNACYKPVIYLYPEAETEVSVRLRLNGHLTCTYPAYNTGWQVTAAPDGTLTDSRGQTYNYLYWEGSTQAQWDMTKGFCVKGADTAAFLEDALERLGLNRKEANEFIVYWLPLMQDNPYNIISFQEARYTQAAGLDIHPAPDTLIRVFMTWGASDNYVNLEPQELTAPTRTGFTVVEWGGTELS